jgi:DNA-binding transcriptional MerR regulator
MKPITNARAEELTIGELSGLTAVNIETIRYYERIKMLPAPPRTASGRRVYGPTETRTLAFIRRSRELGFTLDEIRALLVLSAKNGRRKSLCSRARPRMMASGYNYLVQAQTEGALPSSAALRAMWRTTAAEGSASAAAAVVVRRGGGPCSSVRSPANAA